MVYETKRENITEELLGQWMDMKISSETTIKRGIC
jgi:hypothetical protein